MSVDSLLKEIQAFVNTVDDLYGLYLDATMGFAHNAEEIAKGQRSGSQQLGMSIDELDKREIYLGRGRPSDPDSILQHAATQGSYKARNTRGGTNFILMAQVVIVLIFEYWETEHRGRIASAIGLANQSQLKIPILGDLWLLRNDVIHRKGFVSSRTEEKLKVSQALQRDNRLNSMKFMWRTLSAKSKRVLIVWCWKLPAMIRVSGPSPTLFNIPE